MKSMSPAIAICLLAAATAGETRAADPVEVPGMVIKLVEKQVDVPARETGVLNL